VIRTFVVPLLALAILATAAPQGAATPHEGSDEALPGDFPFALRDVDTIDRVERYITGNLQITSVTCHTTSTAAAASDHYRRALSRIPGFRVTASDRSRTRDDGSTYRVYSIMGVHRFQANISISLFESKAGRTDIEITWRHYVTEPKGAPEGWTPAVYRGSR
jgi:hypothetical protein